MSNDEVYYDSATADILFVELQRVRKERNEAIEHLREVLGGECEKAGRWCLTHRTNDCSVDAARKFLKELK